MKLAAFAALLAALLVSGCATTNGITMTEEEAAACRSEGCTAWTEAELNALIEMVGRNAFNAGQRAQRGSL